SRPGRRRRRAPAHGRRRAVLVEAPREKPLLRVQPEGRAHPLGQGSRVGDRADGAAARGEEHRALRRCEGLHHREPLRDGLSARGRDRDGDGLGREHGRPARARRTAARHRQDRRPRLAPAGASRADGTRVRGDQGPSGARLLPARGPRYRADRRVDPPPPRELGRHRLSRPARRRRDPARRAHHPRRRRARGDDVEPPLSHGAVARVRGVRASPVRRVAVRLRRRRSGRSPPGQDRALRVRVMVLALPFIIGVLVALPFGGRLRNLATLRLKWLWLAYVALVIQIAAFPGNSLPWHTANGVAVGLWIASDVLLVAVVVRNIRLPGVALVAAGLGSNLLAVLANGGHMPALPSALADAGLHYHVSMNSEAMAHPALPWLVDRWAAPH